MLRNYFTIAIRTLLKNKLFTAINVLGLAIGISASLVIFLLINYHTTFDKFEQGNERIYRVVSIFTFSGEQYKNSGVTSPMSEAIKKELTGIESVVPFRTLDGDAKLTISSVKDGSPIIFKKQNNIVFADERFMNLVGYEWVAGSQDRALTQPNQAVITASKLALYFPTLNETQVIGKEFYLNDTIRLTISGVVKDIPFNTDFTFKIFIARATLEHTSLKPNDWDQWNNTNGASQLYLKLSPGTSTAKIKAGIAAIYKKHSKKEPGDNSRTEHDLQPLSKIHFDASFGTYSNTVASKPTLYSLAAVATFLLLLACINFINLNTAHGSQRAKEIGVRKTMGSSRRQLIIQFLNETFILTVAAAFLSVLLTPLLLKAFGAFIPEGLTFNIGSHPIILLFLAALIVIVTLLSGFYPAIVLSSYKPILILKNQSNNNTGKSRNAWLRKTLTVSQFVIAQVFIMGVILVSKQISYSLNKDMGFKKEAILYLQVNYYDTSGNSKFLLLNKLKAIPGVQMISLSTTPPSSNSTWSGIMKFKDGNTEIETDVQQKYADSNYLPLYHLKLLAGTNIASTDTVTSYLVNETYSRILGFQKPEQAIGKALEWSNKKVPIAGVVADFNQKSLHEPIKPLAIGSWQDVEKTINISLSPLNEKATNWKTTIAQIEKAWKAVYPKDDFEYTFFDESIKKFYEAEKNISSLLLWSTVLAIFISCLGLLGLVIFTTAQRTKEIGVRKVLGASITQIVNMISKDFLVLILIAFVIAVPIAVIGMNKWLENFSYRTNLSWWIFLLGGSVMLLIALLTLSFQTVKAALANPVNSLRSE
ncbi:MAG: FtsX-like permease family protein [Bacteroidota bacterium]